MNVIELIKVFDKRVKPDLAEDWDHVGAQLVFSHVDVKRCLVTLEITPKVVEEAIFKNVDIIFTHHPLIFEPLHMLDDRGFKEKAIIPLIQKEISVYAAHTNFDKLKGGNNDCFAHILGLEDVDDMPGSDGIAKISTLQTTMSLKALAVMVADKLKISVHKIRIIGDLNQQIHKVGFCVGAGCDFIDEAVAQECDAFITGDIKYHQGQDGLSKGIGLIDAGHYGTEKHFADNAKNMLSKALDVKENDVEFLASEVDIDPFTVI